MAKFLDEYVETPDVDKSKPVTESDTLQPYDESLTVDENLEKSMELQSYLADERLEKVGRPDTYTDTAIILSNIGFIYEKLVRGDNITSICKQLGVHRRVWYYVYNTSDKFKELVQQAREEQVDLVRTSLMRKTQDRYVKAEKALPNGRVVEYNKYVPADFNAIKFFLLNKASDEFKEKQEIEVRQTNIVVDIIEDVEYVDATPSDEE